MSRGRRRRLQGKKGHTRQAQITHPTIGDESQASANYRNGATVRYRYRINGPTFPVKEYHATD